MTTREPTPQKDSISVGRVVLAWLFVGTPLLWGVLQTMRKAAALFQ